MDDFPMIDFVIYALDEKEGKTKGTEIPGSLTRIMRFPEAKSERRVGRYSGPWEDLRLGLGNHYRWREIAGVKGNRAPRKILEPVTIGKRMDANKQMVEEITTQQPDSFPIKVDQMSGTLVSDANSGYPVFSAENAKYIETIAMYHRNEGTLSRLDDETSSAVYTEELPKLKRLIGHKVWWEFRPYIRTAAGASSGVDEFKLAIVGETSNAMGN